MEYKNNTGGLSKIGYLVKVDSRDPRAFVYAASDETNILGVIADAVPRGRLCEIRTSGTANVFVVGRVVAGTVVRGKKSSDAISLGQAMGAAATDAPYFKIGTATKTGSGLVPVELNLIYIASGSTGDFQPLDADLTRLATYRRIGGNTNYSEFETDGTLVFTGDATVWDDLRIVPGSFDRPGGTDPTIQDWQPGGSGTTFKVWCFDQAQAGYFTCQIPHSYKTGSNMYVHAHWTPRSRGNEENTKTVAWKIDYSWANINGVFGASATADLTDACNGVDHEHDMTPEVSIAGANKTISSMLMCKIYRDTGDTWAGTGANGPALLELDFHFEVDTVGSREHSSK